MTFTDWRQRGAVSREEAAQILGVSPGKVDEMRDELHAKKIGRRVLIPVWALRVCLGESEAPVSRPPPAPISARAARLLRNAQRRAG